MVKLGPNFKHDFHVLQQLEMQRHSYKATTRLTCPDWDFSLDPQYFLIRQEVLKQQTKAYNFRDQSLWLDQDALSDYQDLHTVNEEYRAYREKQKAMYPWFDPNADYTAWQYRTIKCSLRLKMLEEMGFGNMLPFQGQNSEACRPQILYCEEAHRLFVAREGSQHSPEPANRFYFDAELLSSTNIDTASGVQGDTEHGTPVATKHANVIDNSSVEDEPSSLASSRSVDQRPSLHNNRAHRQTLSRRSKLPPLLVSAEQVKSQKQLSRRGKTIPSFSVQGVPQSMLHTFKIQFEARAER